MIEELYSMDLLYCTYSQGFPFCGSIVPELELISRTLIDASKRERIFDKRRHNIVRVIQKQTSVNNKRMTIVRPTPEVC